MADVPEISVLMPVCNAARYVADAVESVRRQTFADFEFVIVDDGSTDGSPRILRRAARRDPRIRVLRQPNGGVTAALNAGLAACRAPLIARMDADDLCVPRRLERQRRYLAAHADCVALGSRVVEMDPYGSPVAVSGQHADHASIDRELMTRSGWAIVHPSAVFRRRALLDAGGYRDRWPASEDHDLYLRLGERGRLANLPEPLLWYRRHFRSVTHLNHARQAAQKRDLLAEAYARRGVAMPPDWRHVPWSPPPPREQRLTWGWCALKAGNRWIAARHAGGAVRAAPADGRGWKLLACVARDALTGAGPTARGAGLTAALASDPIAECDAADRPAVMAGPPAGADPDALPEAWAATVVVLRKAGGDTL
jgi:GT2 family glycosyltransferase